MQHKNDKVAIGLKKASSTLNKVVEMLNEDKYCIDIIQQNLAVIGLLKATNLALLEGHLNCCFKNAAKARNDKRLDEMINELYTVMKIAQNK